MRKPVPILVNHRKIAAMIGESTCQVRQLIEKGVWPRAHSAVGVKIFYRVADIDHFIAKGVWPESMLSDDRRSDDPSTSSRPGRV